MLRCSSFHARSRRLQRASIRHGSFRPQPDVAPASPLPSPAAAGQPVVMRARHRTMAYDAIAGVERSRKAEPRYRASEQSTAGDAAARRPLLPHVERLDGVGMFADELRFLDAHLAHAACVTLHAQSRDIRRGLAKVKPPCAIGVQRPPIVRQTAAISRRLPNFLPARVPRSARLQCCPSRLCFVSLFSPHRCAR